MLRRYDSPMVLRSPDLRMRSMEGIGSLPQLKEGSLESMDDLEVTPKPSPERELRGTSSDGTSGSNPEDSPPQDTGLRLLPPPKKSSPPRRVTREVSPLRNSQAAPTEPAVRAEGELEIESSQVSDIESSFEIISKLSEDTISAHSLDLNGHTKTMSEDTNSPSSHAVAGVMRAHLKAASDDITTAASAVDGSKQQVGWTESQSLTTLDKVGVRARRMRRPNLASVHRNSKGSRGGYGQISEPPSTEDQGDVGLPERPALESIISPTLKKVERKDKPKASKEQSLDEDDLFEMLGDHSMDGSPPRNAEDLSTEEPPGQAEEPSPHDLEHDPPASGIGVMEIHTKEPSPRSTPPQISDAPQPSSTGKPPPQGTESDLEDSQEVLAEFDRIVGGAVESLFETSAGEEGQKDGGVQGEMRRGDVQGEEGVQEEREEHFHEEETDGGTTAEAVVVEDSPHQSTPVVNAHTQETEDRQSDVGPPPEDPLPLTTAEEPQPLSTKDPQEEFEEPPESPPQEPSPKESPEDPLPHSTKEPSPQTAEDPLPEEPFHPPLDVHLADHRLEGTVSSHLEVGVASTVEVELETGTEKSAEPHGESHDQQTESLDQSHGHNEDFEPLDTDVVLPDRESHDQDSLCDQSDGEEAQRDGGDLSDASESHDQLKKQVSEGEDSILPGLAHRLREEEEEEDGER